MLNKNTPPKLLDQVHDGILVKQYYSIRTETQYVNLGQTIYSVS